MYELLVATRYLFKPRLTPGIVAGLVLSLSETAAGALLFFLPQHSHLGHLVALVPVTLVTVWTLMFARKSSRWAPLRTASATLWLLHALLAAGTAAAMVWQPALGLTVLLPAVVTVALAMKPRNRRTSRYALLLGAATGITLTTLLLTALALKLRGSPVSYSGGLLIGSSSLLFLVFLLLCFFSAFTTISVTGVVLGAASLVMVRSVTRGFAQEFQDKVLGFNAHVLVMKNYYGFNEYPEVAKMIRRLPHVTGAAPFTIAEMLITAGRRHTTVLMKGVDPPRVGEVLDLNKYVQVSGPKELSHVIDAMAKNLDKGLVLAGHPGSCQRFDEDGDPIPGVARHCPLPGIMIGKGLARKLGVRVGDVVRLISPTAELQAYRDEQASADAPLARDFRVVATFYCGFEEYDDRLVFVHLRAARHFVNPEADQDDDNAVLGIEIKLDDIYAAGAVAKAIQAKLPEGDYRVITWYELNRPLFEALQSQKRMMTLFVSITVLVAVFGILAALTMMVLNKTREVAILKAMGATKGGVSRIFQFAGVMVGMAGVAGGTLLGILNCRVLSAVHFPLDPKVYLISRLPVLVDWSEVGLIVGAGLVLCFLSTLYPAHKAASHNPVQGLRYE